MRNLRCFFLKVIILYTSKYLFIEELNNTMKKASILVLTLLASLLTVSCSQTQPIHHHHKTKTALVQKKKKEQKEKQKIKLAKRKAAEKKRQQEQAKKAAQQKAQQAAAQQQQAQQAAQQQAANQQTQQQANTQTQQANDAPQPPEGVDPSKWAEHDAYTSDGHLMRQWNDSGQYEGDPDYQYQSALKQEEWARAHGLD